MMISSQEMELEVLASEGKSVGYGPSSKYEDPTNPLSPVPRFSAAIPMHGTICFPAGSDLVGAFRRHLLRMRQSGLLGSNVVQRWIHRRAPPDRSGRIFLPAAEAEVIGFDNLVFPALVLAYGLVAAITLALAERRKKMHRRRPSSSCCAVRAQ